MAKQSKKSLTRQPGRKKSSLDIAKRVLRTEAEAVASLIRKLNSNFQKAVDTLYESKGRVVVTGMGKSGLVGKKIAATLASTGTPSFFLHPAEASHGDLGMVTPDDIIIALSYSGETEEILGLIPFLKRFDVTIIAITGNQKSRLATNADISLDISVKQEACPIAVVPTASTTAAMAMGDAIAVALLSKRGFREEDFALYHPKGSIGNKLFIQVRDLMHTGEHLPVVTVDIPLSKAVIELSSKRLGHCIVVQKNGKMAGLITDGDVRRGLQKWRGKLFEMSSKEVMTKDPKTIAPEELAAKALSIMEAHSITALVIPDGKGRPVGIIHLHDILRQGIA